jgi:hypothetical protein
MPQEYRREVSVVSFSEVPSDYVLYWNAIKKNFDRVSFFAPIWNPKTSFTIRRFQNWIAADLVPFGTPSSPEGWNIFIAGRTARLKKVRWRIDTYLPPTVMGRVQYGLSIGKEDETGYVGAFLFAKYNPSTLAFDFGYIDKNSQDQILIPTMNTEYSGYHVTTIIADLDIAKGKWIDLIVGNKKLNVKGIDLYFVPATDPYVWFAKHGSYFTLHLRQQNTNDRVVGFLSAVSVERLD